MNTQQIDLLKKIVHMIESREEEIKEAEAKISEIENSGLSEDLKREIIGGLQTDIYCTTEELNNLTSQHFMVITIDLYNLE